MLASKVALEPAPEMEKEAAVDSQSKRIDPSACGSDGRPLQCTSGEDADIKVGPAAGLAAHDACGSTAATRRRRRLAPNMGGEGGARAGGGGGGGGGFAAAQYCRM
jgi:hypothetical protein